jgi:hypothetical protein
MGGAGSGTVPNTTPTVRSGNLQYKTNFVKDANDERARGLTIALRRLANPHLPENNTPVIPTGAANPPFQVNPFYNPYITVDYLDKVPLRDNTAATGNGTVATPASRGKRQPYAGLSKATSAAVGPPVTVAPDSPVVDQTTPAPNQNVNHTFGQANTPKTSNGVFDWLVHLDRQVISPMELLHVSGYQPYQLTQQFVRSDKTLATATPTDKYQHLVPWFDPLAISGAAAPMSNRLYRLFEFLETNNRGAGNPHADRHTGKINLNAIWDIETFMALCDAQNSNRFNAAQVQAIWNAFIQARSPGGLPGPVGVSPGYVTAVNTQLNPNQPTYPSYNRPLLPLSTGLSPGVPSDNQNPNVRGINDTLLQQSANPLLRLFEPPAPLGGGNEATTHPYQRYELLTKIFNNVTTRSNVFAVWITVGFFDWNPATQQLGAEIGRSEGRHVRHRLFSIVDRSNVLAFSRTTNNPITAGVPPTQNGTLAYPLVPLMQHLQTTALNDANNSQVIRNRTGMNWVIRSRNPALVQPLVLVYQPGNAANAETVVATPQKVTGAGGAVEYELQAAFRNSHPVGVTVQCNGHPGPFKRYDPRQDTSVVLHYSIID